MKLFEYTEHPIQLKILTPIIESELQYGPVWWIAAVTKDQSEPPIMIRLTRSSIQQIKRLNPEQCWLTVYKTGQGKDSRYHWNKSKIVDYNRILLESHKLTAFPSLKKYVAKIEQNLAEQKYYTAVENIANGRPDQAILFDFRK